MNENKLKYFLVVVVVVALLLLLLLDNKSQIENEKKNKMK